MATYRLSEEQEKAVDTEKSVSVSAGAGSGKTRVLTSRFLKLIEGGIDLDRIVAITFTEKAALEMKERIREAMSANVEAATEDEKKGWQAMLDRLVTANISTIHSFCSGIIKENAALVGIDFNFEILSETEKAAKLEEIASEVLNSKLEQEMYVDVVETIDSLYGPEYLCAGLIEDVLDIRKAILNQDGDICGRHRRYLSHKPAEFILSIAAEVDRKYREHKTENDLLDYNDLETMAFELLLNDGIRKKYQERYDRFLVDEFQDTNEIQKNIIYHLAAADGALIPKRLFIVGDFKQSIYGFRGADYTIFGAVSGDIGEEGRVVLSTSYRCRRNLLEGINGIFTHLIEGYEPLVPAYEKCDSEKRIFVISCRKDSKTESQEEALVKSMIKERKNEPEVFRDSLARLRESRGKVIMPESNRKDAVMKAIRLLRDKGLDFKDICILVRSKYIIQDIEDELKKKNIPYCIIGGRGFYGREEIGNIITLLRILAKGFECTHGAEEDLHFIKVLRSSFFDLPDDILYKLKVERDENPKARNFFEAMDFIVDGMSGEAGEGRELLERAFSILKNLSECAARYSVVRLLEEIIEVCQLKSVLLSQENGIQKFRNIEKLLREAEKFDRTEMFSLEKFIDYVGRLKDEADDSEASLDTENSAAVKIMTIHQSKGLEFEAVIIPGTESDLLAMSRKEREKRNFIYSGSKVISRLDLEEKGRSESAEFTAFMEEKFIREIDESIRMFYVAMTRAKQYAVLVGEENSGEFTEIGMKSEKIEKLNSFGKQLGYALNVKESALEHVEMLDADDLPGMDRVPGPDSQNETLNLEELRERIRFEVRPAPRNTVSASTYMKYSGCPRKYYVERILGMNVPASEDKDGDISGRDHAEEEVLDKSMLYESGISAALLGTLVHEIIEDMNCGEASDEEDIIRRHIDGTGDKETEEKMRLLLEKYIGNYKKIEMENAEEGRLVLTLNEAAYLIESSDGADLLINGFIDRVQVFENMERHTAVVTDYKTNRINREEDIRHMKDMYSKQLYLYGKAVKELVRAEGKSIDDVRLKLYLLDTGESIEIPFDQKLVEDQLKEMEMFFGRTHSAAGIEAFEKGTEEDCEKCTCKEYCRG
jgi:ATP-dependent helicase/nuclease subunit A